MRFILVPVSLIDMILKYFALRPWAEVNSMIVELRQCKEQVEKAESGGQTETEN